jgi:hypothetical protein
MVWIKYNEDEHSKTLEERTYMCRLEYPDDGNSIKRGYFTTNGKKYKVTHFCKFKTLEDD